MEYTPLGLIYTLNNEDKLSDKELVEFINDMINVIDKDYKDFIKDVEIELKQFSYDNNVCNECGNSTTTKIENEYSECRGFDASEEIHRPYCEECKCYLDE